MLLSGPVFVVALQQIQRSSVLLDANDTDTVRNQILHSSVLYNSLLRTAL
jgi:hypothetical protein